MKANKLLGGDADIALADARYEQISKIIESSLLKANANEL
jgi:hypothetical protein